MRLVALPLLIVLLPLPGLAKPLLTDSQKTYASACVERQDTPERLIQICELALNEAGMTQAQRLDMMDALAWGHMDLDREAVAAEIFHDMLEIDQTSADALSGLGWVSIRAEDFAAAVPRFKAAMDQSPSASHVAGYGSSRFRAGQIDLDEALTLLDAALAVDPEYAWAAREKATLLRQEGRLEDAEAGYRHAIEIDPDSYYAAYGLAVVLSRAGRDDEALEQINAALELEPGDIYGLSRRSLILFRLDRPKQAVKDADRVIEADPDWSEGYVRRARALAELGRGSEALDLLEAYDARMGYDNFLVFWWADLLANNGRLAEALAQMQRALDHGEADFHDYRMIAFLRLETGDYAGAKEAANQALALSPGDGLSRLYTALALVGEGKYRDAVQTFEVLYAEMPKESYLDDMVSWLVSERQFLLAIALRTKLRNP